MGMTYAEAGVDIDKKGEAVRSLVGALGFARSGLGARIDVGAHFTGLIEFGEYALSLCTDSVGTKHLIADAMRRWHTIGIDCVAMNVNDMICIGAEPLAFVDYIALDRPDPEKTKQIGIGLDAGAKEANISIVGGEIAVVPDIVKGFDLAGTCLGYVRKERIITGGEVAVGDIILGLESSGIHSNGLTLARRIVQRTGISWDFHPDGWERSIGEELLVPTKIYVKPVLEVLRRCEVHGMANITGGGLRNLLRLREGIECVIERPISPQPIFNWLAEKGEVSAEEMYQTFNMGMGFAIILPEHGMETAIDLLARHKIYATPVGRVRKGRGVSVPKLGLRYSRY
ncbi:MAG: phosphoribosylformylglycinamidine cyclo-ligase [Candidatus Thermoplasmatota archaeon]